MVLTTSSRPQIAVGLGTAGAGAVTVQPASSKNRSLETFSMTNSERAAQIWSVLALAGRNRQVLTFDILSKLEPIRRQRLDPPLEIYRHGRT